MIQADSKVSDLVGILSDYSLGLYTWPPGPRRFSK